MPEGPDPFGKYRMGRGGISQGGRNEKQQGENMGKHGEILSQRQNNYQADIAEQWAEHL